MKLLPKNKSHFHEIILLLVFAFLWNYGAYLGARLIAASWYHHDITTDIDLMIPFVPWTVSIYIGWYIFWAFNYYLCALRQRDERDRFFCADAMAKVICFLIFVIVPTTNIRPNIAGDLDIWERLMKLVYHLDSADNLFPSVHCLVSWFCFIAVRARKDIPVWYHHLSLLIAVAICISTLTTKQHGIVDVFGGILIAEVCYGLAGFPKVCRVYSSIYSHVFKKIQKQREY